MKDTEASKDEVIDPRSGARETPNHFPENSTCDGSDNSILFDSENDTDSYVSFDDTEDDESYSLPFVEKFVDQMWNNFEDKNSCLCCRNGVQRPSTPNLPPMAKSSIDDKQSNLSASDRPRTTRVTFVDLPCGESRRKVKGGSPDPPSILKEGNKSQPQISKAEKNEMMDSRKIFLCGEPHQLSSARLKNDVSWSSGSESPESPSKEKRRNRRRLRRRRRKENKSRSYNNSSSDELVTTRGNQILHQDQREMSPNQRTNNDDCRSAPSGLDLGRTDNSSGELRSKQVRDQSNPSSEFVSTLRNQIRLQRMVHSTVETVMIDSNRSRCDSKCQDPPGRTRVTSTQFEQERLNLTNKHTEVPAQGEDLKEPRESKERGAKSKRSTRDGALQVSSGHDQTKIMELAPSGSFRAHMAHILENELKSKNQRVGKKTREKRNKSKSKNKSSRRASRSKIDKDLDVVSAPIASRNSLGEKGGEKVEINDVDRFEYPPLYSDRSKQYTKLEGFANEREHHPVIVIEDPQESRSPTDPAEEIRQRGERFGPPRPESSSRKMLREEGFQMKPLSRSQDAPSASSVFQEKLQYRLARIRDSNQLHGRLTTAQKLSALDLANKLRSRTDTVKRRQRHLRQMKVERPTWESINMSEHYGET